MAGDLARATAAIGQGSPQVSHRRIADGGTHVKDQRRRARDADR